MFSLKNHAQSLFFDFFRIDLYRLTIPGIHILVHMTNCEYVPLPFSGLVGLACITLSSSERHAAAASGRGMDTAATTSSRGIDTASTTSGWSIDTTALASGWGTDTAATVFGESLTSGVSTLRTYDFKRI